MKAQLTKLLNWFDDKNSVLVALSGGVDSALVAYSAYAKLGKLAIAVTADYKTLAQEELEYAKKISSEIGIKHIVIEYNELDNESFVKNDTIDVSIAEVNFHSISCKLQKNLNLI